MTAEPDMTSSLPRKCSTAELQQQWAERVKAEHRGSLTDLLIGRIFNDNAGKMFEDMEKSIEKAKLSMAS